MPTTSNQLADVPFPDVRAIVAADAKRYQSLPSVERWRRLFALRAWGTRQGASRPGSHPDTAAEVRWQEIQKDLFAHHAR